MEATTSNQPPPGGRTYLVAGHRLYLRCSGTGSPVVVLFNGLGERTPSWAWVQGDVARQTRVCVFDRAGEGWSGAGVGAQDAHQLSADARGLLKAANVPGPYIVAGHSVGGVYALAYAMDYPSRRGWCRVTRLVHPLPVRPSVVSHVLLGGASRVGTVAAAGARGHRAGVHQRWRQLAARRMPRAKRRRSHLHRAN